MGILVLIQLLGFLLGCVPWGAFRGWSPFPVQAESLCLVCPRGGFVLGLERGRSILWEQTEGRSELRRGDRVAGDGAQTEFEPVL